MDHGFTLVKIEQVILIRIGTALLIDCTVSWVENGRPPHPEAKRCNVIPIDLCLGFSLCPSDAYSLLHPGALFLAFATFLDSAFIYRQYYNAMLGC